MVLYCHLFAPFYGSGLLALHVLSHVVLGPVTHLIVGQILSLIELNRTMFCMRGCLIHDLPRISTEYLGSLGMQESDSPRENKF